MTAARTRSRKPKPESKASGVGVVVTEPDAQPEQAVHAEVGDTVEIAVGEDVDRVTVRRPDGSKVTVFAAGGRALYVIDQDGEHVMGGLVVTAVRTEVEKP